MKVFIGEKLSEFLHSLVESRTKITVNKGVTPILCGDIVHVYGYEFAVIHEENILKDGSFTSAAKFRPEQIKNISFVEDGIKIEI